MPCKICDNPKGAMLTNDVAVGRKTIDEASRELGVDPSAFWYHVQNHNHEPTSVRDHVQTDAAMLRECLILIHDRIEILRLTPVNPVNEKMLTSLVHELRGLAVDLAVLEGKLQRLPFIQLNVLTMNFNKIVSFMMTELPPDYQDKLLEFMETHNVTQPGVLGAQGVQGSGNVLDASVLSRDNTLS